MLCLVMSPPPLNWCLYVEMCSQDSWWLGSHHFFKRKHLISQSSLSLWLFSVGFFLLCLFAPIENVLRECEWVWVFVLLTIQFFSQFLFGLNSWMNHEVCCTFSEVGERERQVYLSRRNKGETQMNNTELNRNLEWIVVKVTCFWFDEMTSKLEKGPFRLICWEWNKPYHFLATFVSHDKWLIIIILSVLLSLLPQMWSKGSSRRKCRFMDIVRCILYLDNDQRQQHPWYPNFSLLFPFLHACYMCVFS